MRARRFDVLAALAFLASSTLIAGCSTPVRQVPDAAGLTAGELEAYRDAADAMDAGDPLTALDEIEPLAARTPWHIPSHILRQDAMTEAGRLADLTWYAAEAARHAGDPARALLAARTAPRDGGSREAAYRAVAAQDPSSVWPRIALSYELARRSRDETKQATVFADSGYVAEAQGASARARAARAEAEALAGTVAAERPRLAAAQAVLADILLGDLGERAGARAAAAVRAAEEASQLDPGSASAWERLARARRAASDDAAAVLAFEKAADLAPRNARIRANWGRVLLDLRKDAAAATVLAEAAALDPGDVETALNHAVALYRGHDLDDAVREFERAAALAPGDPRPFEGLALAQAERGDKSDAADAMERYVVNGGADRDGARRFIDEMRTDGPR